MVVTKQIMPNIGLFPTVFGLFLEFFQTTVQISWFWSKVCYISAFLWVEIFLNNNCIIRRVIKELIMRFNFRISKAIFSGGWKNDQEIKSCIFPDINFFFRRSNATFQEIKSFKNIIYTFDLLIILVANIFCRR